MKIFYIAFFLFFWSSLIAASQPLPNGLFVGYERMFVGKAQQRANTDFYPGMQATNLQYSCDGSWFHQVTIIIHNDSVSILKQPIQIKNNKIVFSDSTGGFYHYIGSVISRKHSTLLISAFLDSTKFVSRRFATASIHT
ncbi:MAG: hypothetical protein JWR72_1719 [Flavisolibacter sp.]|nr:hypothetical protein [Flavisolibacter sp.]